VSIKGTADLRVLFLGGTTLRLRAAHICPGHDIIGGDDTVATDRHRWMHYLIPARQIPPSGVVPAGPLPPSLITSGMHSAIVAARPERFRGFHRVPRRPDFATGDPFFTSEMLAVVVRPVEGLSRADAGGHMRGEARIGSGERVSVSQTVPQVYVCSTDRDNILTRRLVQVDPISVARAARWAAYSSHYLCKIYLCRTGTGPMSSLHDLCSLRPDGLAGHAFLVWPGVPASGSSSVREDDSLDEASEGGRQSRRGSAPQPIPNRPP
jgi:hypothetical protein